MANKWPKEWLGVIDTVGCGDGCQDHPPGEIIELYEIWTEAYWGGGGYVGGRRVPDGEEPHRFAFSCLDELKPLTPAARALIAVAKAAAK